MFVIYPSQKQLSVITLLSTNFISNEIQTRIQKGCTYFRIQYNLYKYYIKMIPQNQNLFAATRMLNFQEVKLAIRNGADVNTKRSVNHGWHSKNEEVPLSVAFETEFGSNQREFMRIVELLFESGANLDVSLKRGNWHRSQTQNLIEHLERVLQKLSNENKIRFIKIIKNTVDINKICSHHKARKVTYFKPFLVLMMEKLGIKLNNFRSMQTFNFQESQRQKEEKLKILFKNQFPQLEIEFDNEEADCYISQTRLFYLSDQCDIIEAGCNKIQLKLSPMHIAISKNLWDLVELLISFQADLNQTCKYALRFPKFPSQWPYELKQTKINRNLDNMIKMEKKIWKNQDELRNSTNEQQKKKLKQQLSWDNFSLFVLKTYNIEDELPLVRYKNYEGIWDLARTF